MCETERKKKRERQRDKLDFNVLPTIQGFRMAKEREKEIETDRQRQTNKKT